MSTAALTDAPETRTKARRAARTNARPVAPKVKVTLCLDDDAAQRLAVHSAVTRVDRSDLVSQLVREHLKRFVVQDRSRTTGDTVTDRQDVTAA